MSDKPLLYVKLCHTFRNFVTLFCRESPFNDTFSYVNVRFITHYLYVSMYNAAYKCNEVAKIIYIILHFVLFIVVYLCKQNTNDTFNQLPEVPIREIWQHLTARREQYTKPARPSLTA